MSPQQKTNALKVVDQLRTEAKIRRAAAVLGDGRFRHTKDLAAQAALMDLAASTIEGLIR